MKKTIKTLKDLYYSVVRGSHSNYISKDEFIEAFEEENPEVRKERLRIENRKWIECLDTMLRNFNPKWNPDNRYHSDDYWIYFIGEGYRITPQEVHDHFIEILEENEKYKSKYGEISNNEK